LHRLSSSFVVGYHGCDRHVANKLLEGTAFNASDNGWDWLGQGIYFWEANPRRGLEFAQMLSRWRRQHGVGREISDPWVIGAVVDLGFCLDLTTSTGIQAVASTHDDFQTYCERAGIAVPKNEGGDNVFRRLDCAVINHLHAVRAGNGLPAFDSVKGVFIEGGPIYPGSGFRRSTHVQLCVRNPACIKGVFQVPAAELA
jgi:hypothetical protein